jgi:hypothetical protein
MSRHRAIGIVGGALSVAVGSAGLGQAAVTPASFTGTYSQDFNTFTNASTSLDTTALQGWSANNVASQTDQSASPTGQAIKAVNLVPGSTGTGQAPATLSVAGPINYGSTGGADDADRAFGSRASTATGAGYGNQIIELQLTNDTGAPISAFDLRYDGEIWVNSAGSGLVAYYSATGAASSYVAMGSTFNYTPSLAGIPGDTWAGLDGNAAANRTADIGGAYAPASPIGVGSTFYLRWYDVNDASVSDKGLAIDNVVVAVPEPAALGALSIGGLGLLARRRRGR